jgi:hypothetical protein
MEAHGPYLVQVAYAAIGDGADAAEGFVDAAIDLAP